MNIRKAQRRHAKIKAALQGPSGSGKTFSSLLMAVGLAGSWERVVVIDTENASADLYSHLGNYNVLPIQAPFTPEKYIEAIRTCEEQGMAVIIIDSLSHAWQESGGILDIHGQMQGNSFTNWSRVMPRHQALVNAILQSPLHIIANLRSKQDYVLVEKNGKMVPEKVGLKAVQKEGLDYEFTLVLELEINHMSHASKDRTGLFIDKPAFVINAITGRQIQEWCEEGIEELDAAAQQIVDRVSSDEFLKRINSCISLRELITLFQESDVLSETYKEHFTRRRRQLIGGNGIMNK